MAIRNDPGRPGGPLVVDPGLPPPDGDPSRPVDGRTPPPRGDARTTSVPVRQDARPVDGVDGRAPPTSVPQGQTPAIDRPDGDVGARTGAPQPRTGPSEEELSAAVATLVPPQTANQRPPGIASTEDVLRTLTRAAATEGGLEALGRALFSARGMTIPDLIGRLSREDRERAAPLVQAAFAQALPAPSRVAIEVGPDGNITPEARAALRADPQIARQLDALASHPSLRLRGVTVEDVERFVITGSPVPRADGTDPITRAITQVQANGNWPDLNVVLQTLETTSLVLSARVRSADTRIAELNAQLAAPNLAAPDRARLQDELYTATMARADFATRLADVEGQRRALPRTARALRYSAASSGLAWLERQLARTPADSPRRADLQRRLVAVRAEFQMLAREVDDITARAAANGRPVSRATLQLGVRAHSATASTLLREVSLAPPPQPGSPPQIPPALQETGQPGTVGFHLDRAEALDPSLSTDDLRPGATRRARTEGQWEALRGHGGLREAYHAARTQAATSALQTSGLLGPDGRPTRAPSAAETPLLRGIGVDLVRTEGAQTAQIEAIVATRGPNPTAAAPALELARVREARAGTREEIATRLMSGRMGEVEATRTGEAVTGLEAQAAALRPDAPANAPNSRSGLAAQVTQLQAELARLDARVADASGEERRQLEPAATAMREHLREQQAELARLDARYTAVTRTTTRPAGAPPGQVTPAETNNPPGELQLARERRADAAARAQATSVIASGVRDTRAASSQPADPAADARAMRGLLTGADEDMRLAATTLAGIRPATRRIAEAQVAFGQRRAEYTARTGGLAGFIAREETVAQRRADIATMDATDPEMIRLRAQLRPDQIAQSDRHRAADTEEAGDVAAARARRERAGAAVAVLDESETLRRGLPAPDARASAAERARATQVADSLRDRSVSMRTQVSRLIAGDRPELAGRLLAEASAQTGLAVEFGGVRYAVPADAIPADRTVRGPNGQPIVIGMALREEVASAGAQAIGDAFGRRLVLGSESERVAFGAADDFRAFSRTVAASLPQGSRVRGEVTTTLDGWDSRIAEARTQLTEHRARVAAEYARTQTLLRYYSDEAGAASRDYASFLTYLVYPVTYFTHGGSLRSALEREGRSTIEVQLRSVQEAQGIQLQQLDALGTTLTTAAAGRPPRELTVFTALRAFSERAPDMRFVRNYDETNGALDRSLRQQALEALNGVAPSGLDNLIPRSGYDSQRHGQDLRYYYTNGWDPALREWLSAGGPGQGAPTLRRTADGLTELGVRNEGAIDDAQRWLGTVSDIRMTDILGMNAREWDTSWAPDWLRATGRFLDRPQVTNIVLEMIAIEVATAGAGEFLAGSAHVARLGRMLEEAPQLARAAQMAQRAWGLPTRIVNAGFEALRFGRTGLQTASRLERAWMYGVDAANVFTRSAVQMGMVAGTQHLAGRLARHQFGAHSSFTEAVDILGQFAFISASSQTMRLRSLAFGGRVALNVGTGLAQQAAPQIVRWAMTRGLPPGTPLTAAEEQRINSYGFWISQLVGVAVPSLVHLRGGVQTERQQRQMAHETARGLLPNRPPNSPETRELARLLQEHLVPLSSPETGPVEAARHFEALRALSENPRLRAHLDGEAMGQVLGNAGERLVQARVAARVPAPNLSGDPAARRQALTTYREALRRELVNQNASLPAEHRLSAEHIDAMVTQGAAQAAMAGVRPLEFPADASAEVMQQTARERLNEIKERLIEAGVSPRDAEHAAIGAVHTALIAWVGAQPTGNRAELEARASTVLDVLSADARRIQDRVGAELMLERAEVPRERAAAAAEGLLRLEGEVPRTGLETYLREARELMLREGATGPAAERTLVGELLGRHRDALNALIAERAGNGATANASLTELGALLTRSGFSREGVTLGVETVRGEHAPEHPQGPRFFDQRPLTAEALREADRRADRTIEVLGRIARDMPDVFQLHGQWQEVVREAARAGVDLPASSEDLAANPAHRAFLERFRTAGPEAPTLAGQETEIQGARGVASDVRRLVTPEGEFYIKPFNAQNRDAPRQEVMASRVDQMLGLGIIPETTIRTVNGERVSAQRAVRREDGFTQASGNPWAMLNDRRLNGNPLSDLRALDFLLSAGDRHPGNLFIDPANGRVMAIDNAGSMQGTVPLAAEHLYPTSGGMLPEHYSERFRRAFAELTPERIREFLGDVASPTEIEMFRVRLEIVRRDILAKEGPNAFTFEAPARPATALEGTPVGDSRALHATPRGDSRALAGTPQGDSRALHGTPRGDSRALAGTPQGDSRALHSTPRVDVTRARTSTGAMPSARPLPTSAEVGHAALRERVGAATFDALPPGVRADAFNTLDAPSIDRTTGLRSAGAMNDTTTRAGQLVERGGQAFAGRVALQNLAGLNHALGASGANQVMRLVSETVHEELTREGLSFELFRDRGPNLSFVVAASPANPQLEARVQRALARAESRVAAWAASQPQVGGTRIDAAALPHPKAPDDRTRAGVGIVSAFVPIRRGQDASAVSEASLTALQGREAQWSAGTRPAIDRSLPPTRETGPLPMPDQRSMGVAGPSPDHPRFVTAEAVREQHFVELMTRNGTMTADAARAEFRASAAPRDDVTGFQTAAGRLETMLNAQRFLTDSARRGGHGEAFYVEGDIANLSGLNRALGEAGGDRVFRRVSDIFAQELRALGIDPANISLHRHGGDEISAIVVAPDTRGMTPPFEQRLQQAMQNAQRRVAEMVATGTETTVDGRIVPLRDIVHPKHLGEVDFNGTGLSVGFARIRPGEHADVTLSTADRAVEANKETRLAITREVRAQHAEPPSTPGSVSTRDTQAVLALPPIPSRGSEVLIRRSNGDVEPGWTLVGVSDGRATVMRGNLVKSEDFTRLVEINQFSVGSEIMVRRSDGVVERNWRVTEITRDGIVTAQAPMPDGRTAIRRAPLAELMVLNPVDPSARGIALSRAVEPRAPAPPPGPRAELPPQPSPPQPVRLAAGTRADAQARTFQRDNYLAPGAQIENGYVDGGRGMSVDARTGGVTSSREILVVDRVRDARLRQEMQWAAGLSSIADPVQRAQLIMRRIDNLLSPGGDRRRAQSGTDAWERGRTGQEMLLGDVILTGAGMCRHRALLFKIMAETAGLNVALVRGDLRVGPYAEPHAWNELVLPNGQRLLVDVMNPARDFRVEDVAASGGGMYYAADGRRLY